ncbi:MAG: class I SAM-dependent methyltransferase [Anaerolineae bacterium]
MRPSPLHRFLRFFFWHFYHGFAWTYDFVAALVSIGRWNDWVKAAEPFLRGQRLLEIGFGPGHLQLHLRQGGKWIVTGLDESAQMARMAQQRLQRAGEATPALARGLGQMLPFAAGAFDTVVSTFPTEYIFQQQTLDEIRRVIAPGGRFVMLPAAWIVGRRVLDRLAAWLFRLTDQAPREPAQILGERIRPSLERAGFAPQFLQVEVRSSVVMVIVADAIPKPERGPDVSAKASTIASSS